MIKNIKLPVLIISCFMGTILMVSINHIPTHQTSYELPRRELLSHGVETPPAAANSSLGYAVMKGIVDAIDRKKFTLSSIVKYTSEPIKTDGFLADPFNTGDANLDEIVSSMTVPVIFTIQCLIFAVFTPFACTIFYSVRYCCNSCGGKEGKKEYEQALVMRSVVLAVVLLLFVLMGSIDGMLGSTDFNTGIHYLTDNGNGLTDDVVKFTNEVVGNLNNIPQEIMPRNSKIIVKTLDDGLMGLGDNVTRQVKPEVDAIQDQLALIGGIINFEYLLVDYLENGTDDAVMRNALIEVELGHLNTSVASVRFRNVSGTVYEIKNLPDVSGFADDLPNINGSRPDFNNIRSKLDGLPDIKNTSKGINDSFVEFAQDINAQVANVSKDTNKTLSDLTNQLQKTIDSASSLVDVVTETSNSIKKQTSEPNTLIHMIDGNRNLGTQVLFAIYMLIFSLGVLGIVLRSRKLFLWMMAFIFFFSFFTHLIPTFYIIPTVVLDDICTDLSNVFALADGQAAGALDVVRGCVDGKNFADLLNLDKQIDKNELKKTKDQFDVAESFNFTDSATFNSQSGDITNQNVSSSDFAGFNVSTTMEFNLTQTLLDLEDAKNNVTLLTFDFRLTDIDDALAGLNNETVACCGLYYSSANYSTTFNLSSFSLGDQAKISPHSDNVDFTLQKNASAHETVSEVQATITGIQWNVTLLELNHTIPLERLLVALQFNQTVAKNFSVYLNNNATLLNNLTADLDARIAEVTNSTKLQVTEGVVQPVFAQVDTMIDEATDFSDLGDCSFMGKRYNNLIAGICSFITPGLYAQWFGFCLVGISMMAGLIVYSQLSKRIEFLGTKFGQKNRVAPSGNTSANNNKSTAGLMQKLDGVRVGELMDESNEEGVKEEKNKDGDASMELGFLGLSGKQTDSVEEHDDNDDDDDVASVKSVSTDGSDKEDEDEDEEDEKWEPIIQGSQSLGDE